MNQPNAKSDPVELLMQESGLEELLEARGASPKDIAEVRQKVASRLEGIAKAAPKEEQGTTKIVVGGVSLRITGTIWPLAKCAVKFIIASHDPTGITWAFAADEAMKTLENLQESVHRLDPVERIVCTAVGEKRQQHKDAGIASDGASHDDIVAYFKERKEQTPRGLEKVLAGLVEKKVLASENDAKRGTLYRITF